MNTGDHPSGMSSERRDLIEALELHGYDLHDGVPKDWRDTLSDDVLACETAGLDTGAAGDLPDVSEMAEAITELIVADRAWSDANPNIHTHPDTPEWRRYAVAIGTLRGLAQRINKGMEAFK